MEHIISMTRQELKDQLDATSRLCERLTQAVKTLAEERDAARRQRDDAEKLIAAIARGDGSDQSQGTQLVLIRMAAGVYMTNRSVEK